MPVRHLPDDEDDPLFRIQPVRSLDELRPLAMAAKPPREDTASLRAPDMVELTELIPDLRLDLRYATPNNFMGAAFYPAQRAFMQRPAAEALRRVQRDLRAEGLGLVIYDAYRPWYVTKMFWDATPEHQKAFVATPSLGSRHNRGCAVDAGLVDLATGKILPMPSGYDEFTERAHADYQDGPPHRLANRETLRAAMAAHDFEMYDVEWWHFDYKDWDQYPILNEPFQAIG